MVPSHGLKGGVALIMHSLSRDRRWHGWA